jgi:acetate---CoA ligase (ADP-forming)
LIVEQLRSPKRFLALVRQARSAGKYVVLLHPGASKAARASAATHTGALAGDYELMRTLVTRAGVSLVQSLEELVDVTQILTKVRELPRKGAAVFTESGAFKALTLDLCDRIGLALPSLSEAAFQALRAALPPFIPPSNPLDLTAQALVDPTLYRSTLPAVLQDEEFGSVVLAIILTDPATTALKLPPILEAIDALRPQKPVIFAALDEGAPFDAEGIEQLRAFGVPCFPSAERALRALQHVTALGRRFDSHALPLAAESISETFEAGLIPEHRAKAILRACGVPVPDGQLARSVDEAVTIARAIGYPLTLKAQAVELSHKSDVGGVILGLENEAALLRAWDQLHKNLDAQQAGLQLDGVLVERMAAKGLELIFGARNDPDWGPVLLAGAGGVLAEAMGDVRLMAADLSEDEISAGLGSLKCAPLLRGFRGSPPLDIKAAARILMTLGGLIRAHPEIDELDINPVVVLPDGAGAIALDALIRIAKRDTRRLT